MWYRKKHCILIQQGAKAPTNKSVMTAGVGEKVSSTDQQGPQSTPWNHQGSRTPAPRISKSSPESSRGKFNPGLIPGEASGRGRGPPRLALYCPPTKRRGRSRVLPGSTFSSVTSQTTRKPRTVLLTKGPLFPNGPLGVLTLGDTEAPRLESPYSSSETSTHLPERSPNGRSCRCLVTAWPEAGPRIFRKTT